jgi:hypothetical protein
MEAEFFYLLDAPVNLADTLREIHEGLRDLNNSVRTGRAETVNLSVRLRNRIINPAVLIPVQKTVSCSIIAQFFCLYVSFTLGARLWYPTSKGPCS